MTLQRRGWVWGNAAHFFQGCLFNLPSLESECGIAECISDESLLFSLIIELHCGMWS